ncbi:hypothetical protein B0H13DRAFT_2659774 [Mycena leptocephala]|nr:hypothetical protein B0H13DRAFT_2659774 [Mycena leptocephala]
MNTSSKRLPFPSCYRHYHNTNLERVYHFDLPISSVFCCRYILTTRSILTTSPRLSCRHHPFARVQPTIASFRPTQITKLPMTCATWCGLHLLARLPSDHLVFLAIAHMARLEHHFALLFDHGFCARMGAPLQAHWRGWVVTGAGSPTTISPSARLLLVVTRLYASKSFPGRAPTTLRAAARSTLSSPSFLSSTPLFLFLFSSLFTPSDYPFSPSLPALSPFAHFLLHFDPFPPLPFLSPPFLASLPLRLAHFPRLSFVLSPSPSPPFLLPSVLIHLIFDASPLPPFPSSSTSIPSRSLSG